MAARQLGLLLWKNSILKRRSYLGLRIPVSRGRRLAGRHFLASGCLLGEKMPVKSLRARDIRNS